MLADQGSHGDKPGSDRTTQNTPQPGAGITAPTISLPKGGGAIRGMGEKFAANPVTGTGSMTVPIATSRGRAGFVTRIALASNLGIRNRPFGFGRSQRITKLSRANL